MSAAKEQRISVLCDFDGTITKGGVLDLLYKTFADSCCWELVERWIRGELTTPEEMRGCFASMKASREEMEAVLRKVQIDPDFPELVRFCAQRDYPLAILSDGLRWYIEYILSLHGFGGLPIYANEIQFSPDGIRITTPWFSPQTPRRGVSKPSIIQSYKEKGFKVIFIGDGLSDLEAVGAADQLYARDELLAYCREKGIPATGFSSMGELMEMWENTTISSEQLPERSSPSPP